MQAYFEGRQKVPVYVPTAMAPSLVTRDIRAPKENAFIACLFKSELSEANALIEHCLVLCFFWLTSFFFKNSKVLYLCET